MISGFLATFVKKSVRSEFWVWINALPKIFLVNQVGNPGKIKLVTLVLLLIR